MLTPHKQRRSHRLAEVATVLALLVMLAACASTQVSDRPGSPTDFSGTWQLNDELSEDPAEIARTAAEAGRSAGRRGGGAGARGGRGGGGRGGGGGGRAGGGGGRAGGGGPGGGRGGAGQSLREVIDEVAPEEEILVIEQSADKLRKKFGDRGSSYHGFDSTRFVQLAGQDAEQLSGWQDNDFVVETSTEDDLVVTERWVLAPDASQITQTLEIEAEQLKAPISITRVFDRQ